MDADILSVEIDVTDLKSDLSDLKADVAVLKADVLTLKADVSQIKSDVSGLKMDMIEMEGRLGAQMNRQIWTMMSVMATLMVASVGLTGYFVKILA